MGSAVTFAFEGQSKTIKGTACCKALTCRGADSLGIEQWHAAVLTVLCRSDVARVAYIALPVVCCPTK